MSDVKKPIRLVDVGELEARLRETLEEKLREPDLDELAPHSESISCELEDLGSLPTIHPDDLRGHAKWVKDENVKIIAVDAFGNTFESPAVYCENCNAALSEAEFKGRVWNFCPVCGFIMEDTTNGQ